MEFVTYSNASQPTVMLTPGLGVSYEIFRGMNHGELLIEHPTAIAKRIDEMLSLS